MIDYTDKIPNNVDLGRDRVLQRALEHWQPAFLELVERHGPEREPRATKSICARRSAWNPTAGRNSATCECRNTAGEFSCQPRDPNRQVNFGARKGEPAWQDVPGEYRSALRRIIVTQGDTEPASVEQQKMLGLSCPSLYDLRNIFQVNVEEGRHLWAMVYLLHRYFGRDGREEAEALLARRSGDADNPRILGAFNEPTPDWLAFYMFTFFTDRDGKFQLCSLAESGFDPLARTCRFMLTEEAHHMFVGETGVGRVIQRTCEVMNEHKIDDPADVRKQGVIDLQTMQRYLNFHYSVTLDLYGSDISSNAANYYTNGLKGRFEETKLNDDHVLTEATYPVSEVVGRQDRHPRDSGADRAERAAARRLHQGNRVGPEPLEPHHRKIRDSLPPDAAAHGLSSRHRQFRRAAHQPGGRSAERRGVEESRVRVAAEPRGLQVRAVA